MKIYHFLHDNVIGSDVAGIKAFVVLSFNPINRSPMSLGRQHVTEKTILQFTHVFNFITRNQVGYNSPPVLIHSGTSYSPNTFSLPAMRLASLYNIGLVIIHNL